MRLRYIGGGPATAGGTFALAWTPDSTNNTPGEQPGLGMALSAEKNALVRMDSNASFLIPPAAAYKWYQTDSQGPLGDHGAVVAILVAPPTGIKGSVAITVVLDWVVEWSGRKLEVPTSGPRSVLKPDPGYTNMWTTSDGSFDAAILTFKTHAGGEMVPFSRALPGQVFTTKGTTTVVPYISEDGSEKKAEWFSLVIGYTVKGLVLHANEANAHEYQRTGDRAMCLHYKGPGNYVTPASPEFKVLVAPVHLPPPTSEELLRRRVEELERALRKLDLDFPEPASEIRNRTLSQ